jgi:hypothetical protein
LVCRPDDGQQHHRHRSPQDKCLNGHPSGGVPRRFPWRAAARPRPRPRRHGCSRGDRQRPGAEKNVEAGVPEQEKDNRDIDQIDGHGDRDEACHRIDLLGANPAHLAFAEVTARSGVGCRAADPTEKCTEQAVTRGRPCDRQATGPFHAARTFYAASGDGASRASTALTCPAY